MEIIAVDEQKTKQCRTRRVSPEILALAQQLCDEWHLAVFKGEMAFFEDTNEAMKKLFESFGSDVSEWYHPTLSMSVGLRTHYLTAEEGKKLEELLIKEKSC